MVDKSEIDSVRTKEHTLMLLEASIGVCGNISDNNNENTKENRCYA